MVFVCSFVFVFKQGVEGSMYRKRKTSTQMTNEIYKNKNERKKNHIPHVGFHLSWIARKFFLFQEVLLVQRTFRENHVVVRPPERVSVPHGPWYINVNVDLGRSTIVPCSHHRIHILHKTERVYGRHAGNLSLPRIHRTRIPRGWDQTS